LFEKVGLDQREPKDMVRAFFEEIRDALQRGEGVKLLVSAIFNCATKPQRPRT